MAKIFGNFEDLVNTVNKPGVVLLDCFTTWCGPCKMMAPVMEELSKDFEGRATVGKVDVENIAQAGNAFRVTAVPTLIFFKDGKEVAREVGFKSKADLTRKLESFLK